MRMRREETLHRNDAGTVWSLIASGLAIDPELMLILLRHAEKVAIRDLKNKHFFIYIERFIRPAQCSDSCNAQRHVWQLFV